jgi:hypothetical protein
MSRKQEKLFREKIETMRIDMVNRIDQLYKHAAEYKAVDNFENSKKCDIKRQQLIMVLGRLDEALK